MKLPSACILRLITEFSGLKLQAIINAQIDSSDCLKWGNKISEMENFSEIESVHPIHSRLIKEPDFIVGDIYFNSIKSLIINFTSTLEYYLRDNTKLNMMRNYSLLKKGLNEQKITITPNDIVEIDNIEQIRYKYIIKVSNIICSGELWTNKFKAYVKFMSLTNSLFSEAINKKIDSFWEARNDIAHKNKNKLSLIIDETTYEYDSQINVAQYSEFALLFIKLVDDTIAFLSKVDALSLEKWEATDATLLKNR